MRSVSKQGHLQLRYHSKVRTLSRRLENGLLLINTMRTVFVMCIKLYRFTFFRNYSTWFWTSFWHYKYGNCFVFNSGEVHGVAVNVFKSNHPGPSEGRLHIRTVFRTISKIYIVTNGNSFLCAENVRNSSNFVSLLLHNTLHDHDNRITCQLHFSSSVIRRVTCCTHIHDVISILGRNDVTSACINLILFNN